MCHDVGHITWPGCGQKYSSSDQIVYKKHQACPSCACAMTKLEHWFGHLVHFLDAANCCMLSGQTWKPIGHSSEQDSAQAVH